MSIMNNASRELEVEIFDPTGHGIEVVDADYARRFWKECEDAKGRAGAAEHAAICSQAEISSLRQRLMEIDSVLDQAKLKDPFGGAESSADILRRIVRELSELRTKIPNGAGGAVGEFDPTGRTSTARQEGSGELTQISEEVAEFCDHPECTTLDAVRLMKCHLRELQAESVRQRIYRRWRE
jgi:hypothetical protein